LSKRGRTALHYSAVLSDGGQIYKLLVDFGADQQATDMVRYQTHEDIAVKEKILQILFNKYQV